eukprot:Rmarinus@m.29573
MQKQELHANRNQILSKVTEKVSNFLCFFFKFFCHGEENFPSPWKTMRILLMSAVVVFFFYSILALCIDYINYRLFMFCCFVYVVHVFVACVFCLFHPFVT